MATAGTGMLQHMPCNFELFQPIFSCFFQQESSKNPPIVCDGSEIKGNLPTSNQRIKRISAILWPA